MSAVAGVAGAVVVLACAGPRARRAPSADGGPPSRGGARGPGPSGGVRQASLESVLVTVGTQLRAGRSPRDAWQGALGTAPRDDGPSVADLLRVCGSTGPGRRGGIVVGRVRARAGVRRRSRVRAARQDPRLVERAAAVVAAARTAHELGAPLADVLARVSESLAADAAERDDVEAALAGPRATARVLAWLPLLGVGLGAVLGADPVRVLLGGGPGSTAGVVGLLLVVAGRRWTARLLARAVRS